MFHPTSHPARLLPLSLRAWPHLQLSILLGVSKHGCRQPSRAGEQSLSIITTLTRFHFTALAVTAAL